MFYLILAFSRRLDSEEITERLEQANLIPVAMSRGNEKKIAWLQLMLQYS